MRSLEESELGRGLYQRIAQGFERPTHRIATWRTGAVTLAWHPCAVALHPSHDLNWRQEFGDRIYGVWRQSESPPLWRQSESPPLPLAGMSTPEQAPRSYFVEKLTVGQDWNT